MATRKSKRTGPRYKKHYSRLSKRDKRDLVDYGCVGAIPWLFDVPDDIQARWPEWAKEAAAERKYADSEPSIGDLLEGIDPEEWDNIIWVVDEDEPSLAARLLTDATARPTAK